MDYTEIDKIINNAPGSEIDVPFFEELKTNLIELKEAIDNIAESLPELLKAAGENADLPTYADNTAALQAEAPIGSLYATPSGDVKIVLDD